MLCLIFDHTTFGDWESAFGDDFQKLEFTLWTIVSSAGKYAQVTNNPENDGCINGVLLV
jgi:hypothetical protein